MCNIKTLIDLELGILFVESPRCKEKLQIKLKPNMTVGMRDEIDIHAQRFVLFAFLCDLYAFSMAIATSILFLLIVQTKQWKRVAYAEAVNIFLSLGRHEVQSYGNEVNSWFSDAVGQSCTLLRNSCALSYTCSKGNSNTGNCKDVDAKLNFVNEAQLLLVSEESVADLNNRLRSSMSRLLFSLLKYVGIYLVILLELIVFKGIYLCLNLGTQKGSYGQRSEVSTMRFRPNLVISGGEPYAEDGWKSLEIGGEYFTVSAGK